MIESEHLKDIFSALAAHFRALAFVRFAALLGYGRRLAYSRYQRLG
jgi:hypothetical protein